MEKLPPEILARIVILLHQQDKLECMTVCQQWKEIIATHCLFHTVCIFDEDSLECLEALFRQYPPKGAQTKYLVLALTCNGPLDLGEFLCLLPNVKYIYSNSSDDVFLDLESKTQPWHERIEQISLRADQPLTQNLVFTKKLSQLKRLSLFRINVLGDEFFGNLQNMSTLSHLTLFFSATNLSLTQMERLHEKLPLLEYLKLDAVTLAYEPLPSDISPAIHLVKLCLTSLFSSSVKTNIVWLDYISRKYPNMIDLENSYRFEQRSNEDGTINVVEGYNALFQEVGSRLKRFHLKSERIPTSIFQIMDKSGCQLEHLEISDFSPYLLYNGIQSSEQAQYIHTLNLKFESLTHLYWLKDMPVLTTLTLNCKPGNKNLIEFTRFLDICPDNLESLILTGTRLKSTLPCSPHSLRSLSLVICDIFEDFDVCVSACLPQLTFLKFGYCSLPARFTLLGHALSRFEVIRNTQSYQLQVTTRKDTKMYILCYNNIDRQDYENDAPSLYPSPMCRPQGTTPNLILECASVDEVVLL